MQFFYLVTAAFAIAPAVAMIRHDRRSCDGGKYQCGTSSNGTSIIEVCSNDAWHLAAYCDASTKCVTDAAGGANCAKA
ncbi:hypothetical protein F4780DRAFT_372627 [Xylariomycetidae sp. FL0641]|nr:hypothetical protein F4780DRAFT_372627 [Xylariomycetidae sp. FL0641]